LIGSISKVSVAMPRAVLGTLEAVTVTMCKSDDDCADVTFSATPANKTNGLVEDGIFLDQGAYSIDLAKHLDSVDWDADSETALTVTATNHQGVEVIRHNEAFRFATSYPNGEICDETPYLMHRARVSTADATTG
jgi:hypothetical protein